jgi:DNA polymerase-3 subunit alpha/error-prone DNA polymerase
MAILTKQLQASSGLHLSNLLAKNESFDFVELLAKSNFSFLQGASHPSEMVEKARELGYAGLSLCDRDGFYGIVRGFEAAYNPSQFEARHLGSVENKNFKYFFGVELTLQDSSPIALLPMNKSGYVRLSRLLTVGKRRAPKGQIELKLEEILENNEDLIAVPLPPWSFEEVEKIQSYFQDRIYLPVCKDFSWEAVHNYQQALQIEETFNIPIFATQRPLFHSRQRKDLHDVLSCIFHGTTLSKAETKLLANGERHLKTLAELKNIWAERMDAIARTNEIASRLQFSLEELRYRYPSQDLPQGQTASDYLRTLTEQGLKIKYPQPEAAQKLLNTELELIKELGYEDYFLTLWDICSWARSKKILFQGRGSAANSIVCYTLGLTAIDPVQMKLLFGRFLSRERREPPDIDIDFEHERREEVIQHIYQKYGSQRAAMICTVVCYRSRMAVREVAKTLGLELEQINKLIKFMGREGLSRLLQDPKKLPEFGLSEEVFEQLLRLAQELQGFPRHLGIHSGGFIISQDDLIDLVPIEKARMNDRYVVQWNKDDIETLKMMKVDILSLGMLTVLRRCFELLDSSLTLDTIPVGDTATYQMIQKADTVGIFQIESRAQMSLLPRLKPREYYDLVIQVAIVRPGPLQGGMVHPFIRRRNGLDQNYVIPTLMKHILTKTCGVPIFQEQIMQIAIDVAGFTPGEADELRRIMSSAWTRPSTMEGLRLRLLNGLLSRGLSMDYAEQIFKTMQAFVAYGFPESHSASFALLTYASSYLKAHHHDVFTCALLNSQPMGFYAPRSLIADAQRHGVIFEPLDVQTSSWLYALDAKMTPNASSYQQYPKTYPQNLLLNSKCLEPKRPYRHLRVGFCSLYGLAQNFAERIESERKANGLFFDLTDFIRRTRLPRAVLLRLGTAGALHSLGVSAREALWMLQSISLDEKSLTFGHTPSLDQETQSRELQFLPIESAWERLQREYHSKGFSLDLHPLSLLRPSLLRESQRYTRAREVPLQRHRSRLRLAGLLSLLQKPPTAKGFCFLSLEDETGVFNIILEPVVYEKYRLLLFESPLLKIEGILESAQGVFNIKARHIEKFDSSAIVFESPLSVL